MTADPNLAVQLGGILATAHANDMTHQETAAMLVNALQPCIATALREARAQALEEAAKKIDCEKKCDGRKKSVGGRCVYSYEGPCQHDQAEEIRALKHKDGQP